MSWTIKYHPKVKKDVKLLGNAKAETVREAICAKLSVDPLSFGEPLQENLASYRKLRVGDVRVVYRVVNHEVMVFVLAIGYRRDIYQTASKRI